MSIALPGGLCVCVIHYVPGCMWAESLKLKETPSALLVSHKEERQDRAVESQWHSRITDGWGILPVLPTIDKEITTTTTTLVYLVHRGKAANRTLNWKQNWVMRFDEAVFLTPVSTLPCFFILMKAKYWHCSILSMPENGQNRCFEIQSLRYDLFPIW